MKRKITLLALLLCFVMGGWAQNVTVVDAIGQPLGTFLQNHLMGGGVYVFNAKFSNSASNISTANIGTFQTNGYQGLQMDSGIVMTTGNINVVPGPNNLTSASNPIEGYYSDPVMEMVATSDINGCATLDFDFVTLSDQVMFNYTFASEEYPEYVCSNFNDVFAFFVTGPDPETGEEVTRNIAIIPGTIDAEHPNGIAVAINSVNSGQAGTAGGSGSGCYYDYANLYEENATDAAGIQYDGYTTKLMASASIIPCAVYHMHISVCNVGDNSYDSGVFLEANSFVANMAAIGLSRPGVTNIYGTCPNPIPLSLAATAFDEGTVHFSFGGTAVEGVDYVLTDENGQPFGADGMHIDNDTHSFIIQGLPSADLSEPKSIVLYLATSLCSAFPQLVVYDTMRFSLGIGSDVAVKDTTITCTHACFEVGTQLLHGTNVTYQWIPTTGLDNPYSLTTSAMIFESADYQLIATGGSGCYSDTAQVHVVITGSNPDRPVGINDTDASAVQVYPNPASDVIHIRASKLQRVDLYNLEGKRVCEHSCDGSVNGLDLSIDGLTAGVYSIRIIAEAGITAMKIVVNK